MFQLGILLPSKNILGCSLAAKHLIMICMDKNKKLCVFCLLWPHYLSVFYTGLNRTLFVLESQTRVLTLVRNGIRSRMGYPTWVYFTGPCKFAGKESLLRTTHGLEDKCVHLLTKMPIPNPNWLMIVKRRVMCILCHTHTLSLSSFERWGEK